MAQKKGITWLRAWLNHSWEGAPSQEKQNAPPKSPKKPKELKQKNSAIFWLPLSQGGSLEVVARIKPQAKRMILRMDRQTNKAILTLPARVSRGVAQRFLEEHLTWLEAQLAKRPTKKAFDAGCLVPLRGELVEITHCLPFRGKTRKEEVDGKTRLLVHGASAQIAARVERFLREEALTDLTQAATRFAGILGVSIGKITIKDTRSRWGSCSARGDLAFSWRLILAPSFVLEYLAAHEVAHRVEMNHSLRYWRVVARLFPRFREAEHWLKKQGAELHFYG